MTDSRQTVYVVEDDASFRRSVERVLRAAGLGVESFGTATELIEAIPRLRRPACLLLDVRLPDLDGTELQERLPQLGIPVPIILMTGHGNIAMGVTAMKKGAVDFLPKPFDTDTLLAALREALERDTRACADDARRHSIEALVERLTPRELEVMRWVITGLLNKQIADAMCIAEKTVRIHRSRLMQKVGVSSVAELVRLAEHAGIPPAGVETRRRDG